MQAILFTPLPFYRPYILLTALRELRPLELQALWRSWHWKGWITPYKAPSWSAQERRTESLTVSNNSHQHDVSELRTGSARRSAVLLALEAKCKRPFTLSK